MNKLSKAKRDQLILVALFTLMAIGGLWYLVITSQQQKIVQQSKKMEQVRTKLSRANVLINKAGELQQNLEKRVLEVDTKEGAMAPERDTYAWMLKTISGFVSPHTGVSIAVGQPEPITGMAMLPGFFYRSCVFKASGVGHYHDIGKFVADFENSFPYFHIENMDIAPASGMRRGGAPRVVSGQGIKDGESLEFRFDIVVPVRPADSSLPPK